MAEKYTIIDAHIHLWERQAGMVNGLPVYSLGNGKSSFLGEVHPMMPPYMEDNRNTAERLVANMDYAGVCACAVTQEYLDGNQDEYLLRVKAKYPDRFRIAALYEDGNMPKAEAICEEIAKTDRERYFDRFDYLKTPHTDESVPLTTRDSTMERSWKATDSNRKDDTDKD